jgi:hypothetical protein
MAINRKSSFQKKDTVHKDGAKIRFGNDSKLLQSEFYKGPPRRYNKRATAIINKMSSRMVKTAAAGCGGTDTRMSNAAFYHPEYEPSSLLMPRDPIEINAWARYFYKYDALVSTAVDCHAELPISTIRLSLPPSSDKRKARAIQSEYEEMCSTEYLDLFNKMLQIGVEYYKLGNVFPFVQWNEKKKMWTRLTILDPDYVEVDKLQFTDKMRVDLRPNDRLKEIASNGPEHPKTGILFKSLPEDVVELIRSGKKIPLNTNPKNGSHVGHIAYKMADYDTLGTGLIERNFKPLAYKDRLRQAQDAIATRHLTPKHLLWADYQSNADVETVRQQVDNAFADPDYAIITNYELHWELVGTGSGMMQLDSEWNWLTEELMIGLMINKSFLLGEGSYANGQTVLEVMNQRYSIYRERLESWIIHNIFLPMAKHNDWAEYAPGTIKKEKRIIWLYPRVKWNRLNFVDDTAHKQMLSQMVTAGQIDVQTWLECFGLDPETIKERLKNFEGTPLDINYVEMMRNAAAEVGRALAPAIAELRAKQMGLEVPKEGAAFKSKQEDKMTKTGEKDGTDKTAETREERQNERETKRLRRRKRRELEALEVPLNKGLKPPREDMKSPKLNLNKVEAAVPFIDPEKAEAAIAEVQAEDVKKDAWTEKMMKLGADPNSRRAAAAMEEEILSLNGDNNSKSRIKAIRKFLPQILASDVEGENLMDRVEAAKVKYADKIMDMSYDLDAKLSEAKTSQETKQVIRSILTGALTNETVK